MTSAHHAPIKYRPEIDGLRALAVLMVVIVHAFPNRLTGGFIGVDVFFVISGFLIASILMTEMQQQKFSFVQFYIRRANRIFPALILVLLATLIFGWFALYVDEFKSLGRSVAAGAAFFANINLFSEIGYWDVASKLKPLLHLWSLGVEEQFYFFFPGFLWLLWRKKFNIVSALLACILLSGLYSLISIKTNQAAAFYLPLQRAWELIGGAFLAYLTLNSNGQRSWFATFCNKMLHKVIYQSSVEISPNLLNNVMATLGLGMIAFAALYLNESIPFPGPWAIFPVAGAMLLIAAGQAAWINRKIFSNKIAVYIGLISFPLYLWHWPLLSFIQIIETGEPPNRLRNLAVLLSFILAAATYHLIEKPLRTSSKARGAKALALTAVLLALGAAGFTIYASKLILPKNAVGVSSSELFIIQRPAIAQADSNPCFKALPQVFKANLQSGALAGTQVHCGADKIEDVNLAMIGDSNAGHFAKDLHDRYPKTLLTVHSAGRPFMRDFYDDANSQAVLSFLVEQKQIKTIIISHLGAGFVQGEDPLLGLAQAFNWGYEGSLKKTIRLFQDAGKRVILISSIPVLDFDPKRCNTRPFSQKEVSDKDCAIPRDKIRQTHAGFLGVMKKIRADIPQLEILDAMDYLCDAQTCYAKKNGQILYTDRKHVNFLGSKMVMQPLITMIERGAAK